MLNDQNGNYWVTVHWTTFTINAYDSVESMHHNKANFTLFLPEASFGLRVLSLPPSFCLCVCVCVNHLLVRAITCRPFKLESPNLDQKSKTPWLRSLLFWGLIDLELQGQIELKSEKLPYFQLLHAIIHHLSKIRFLNLNHKCTLALLRSLLILGLIDIVLQSHF